MYYRQALELQCFLEFAGDDGQWFLPQILVLILTNILNF